MVAASWPGKVLGGVTGAAGGPGGGVVAAEDGGW